VKRLTTTNKKYMKKAFLLSLCLTLYLIVQAAPVITSFKPIRGIVGSKMTITGTGFSATPSNNIVYFGDVKATVSSSTTTTVTVTVPAGAGSVVPVSVVVDGLMGSSVTSATPTYSLYGTPNIVPDFTSSTISVGQSPLSIRFADFNKDGYPDIASVVSKSNYVNIQLGNGAGSFTATTSPTVGATPVSLAISDFNGDANPDIVTANATGNSISILLGNGNGTFQSAVSLAAGSYTASVAVADFNGDGKMDIVAANSSANTLSVFLGNGNGTFGAATSVAVGQYPTDVEIADFNHDQKADIAVSNSTNGNVGVLLGIGNGSFNTMTTFTTGTSPTSVAVGDFNGDGHADMAVVNYGSANVSILLGDGVGSFGTASNNSLNIHPAEAVVADFDNDGDDDLAVAEEYTYDVRIMMGFTAGTFVTQRTSSTAIAPYSIAVGDFNLDGKADLVTGTSTGNNMNVLLGTGIPQGARITSIAPVSGTIGTTVTINGTGFSATPTDNTVFFGAVRATVSASTTTSITVAVPAGAGSVVPVSVYMNGYASSIHSTTPTFDITSAKSLELQYTTNSFAAGAARDVKTGDFNKDGIPDLVTVGDSYVLVSLGKGGGWFGTSTSYSVSGAATALEIVDFNADNRSDLLVTTPSGVAVFSGKDDGSFGTPSYITDGSSADDISIGDFDFDGQPDVALVTSATGVLKIIPRNSVGSIDTPQTYTANSPGKLAVGEFSGDQMLDIATVSSGTNRIDILHGNIDGTFSTINTIASLTNPKAITTGDFNGDGKLDLATANYDTDNIGVLLSNGDGTYNDPVYYPAGDGPMDIAVGDFNGDGISDLAACSYNSGNVSIFVGNGNGTFAAAMNVSTVNYPSNLVIGDFDGNGKADLAVTSMLSGGQILLFATPPPVINSISPAKGGIGTTVTITGSGFSAVPTENTVHFGAEKATISASTETSITVTVPAGAGSVVPVSVMTDGLIGYSITSTTPTFAITQTPQINPTFALSSYAVGTHPISTEIADFNNDGIPDLAVVNEEDNNVSVLLGTGGGAYGAATNISIAGLPFDVAIGDFNSDGNADMAVVGSDDGYLTIVPGNGDGTFGTAIRIYVTQNPQSVVVGDFNGDGKADLATTNTTPHTVSILLGNGANSFTLAFNYDVTEVPAELAVGDFNEDKKADLVVTHLVSDGHISIFLGANNGAFGVSTAVIPTTMTMSVAVGDFNGDGHADVVLGDYINNAVNVLLGTGVGTFGTATSFAVETHPSAVRMGDFNGDGKIDLAVTCETNNVCLLLGNGKGAFVNTGSIAVGTNPDALAVGDLDGNGKADIVVANIDSKNISVLLSNATTAVKPVITSLSAVSGPIGTVVTVLGSGFNAVPALNDVYFGAVKATITACTSSYITVTVPAGTGSIVPVTVVAGGLVASSTSSSTPTFNVTNTPNLTPGYTKSTIGGANTPIHVAFADLNNDGLNDMLTSNLTANYISVALGTGSGNFGTATNISTQYLPYAFRVGEFNGDSNLDIAFVNAGSNTVSIMLGNGDGTFLAANSFSVGSYPSALALGDFNSDGKLDISVSNYSSANISILLGTGTGSLGTATNYAVGTNPSSISIGDFNKDGKSDLVTTNDANNNMSVLLGVGDGTFGAATYYGTGRVPSSVAVSDFNSDGNLDLAVANKTDNTVTVFFGTATGNFINPYDLTVGIQPFSIATGDMNGDGKADIVTANESSATVSVLLGSGTGTFGTATSFEVGTLPRCVTIADFDGNGKADIATTNYYSNDVSLLLYSEVAPTLTTQAISSITTTTATGNGTITDLGSTKPTQYGVVWSTSINPTIALATKTEQGAATVAGAFASSITGLAPGTTYYVRAYATNSAGTNYGNNYYFTTASLSDNALNFDGVDDYVAIPSVGTNLSAFTIEAWINPKSLNDAGLNAILNTIAWQSQLVHLQFVNRNLGLSVYDQSSTFLCTAPIQTNAWQHIALTYDVTNSKICFYKNGVLTDTYTRTLSLATISEASIGSWGSSRYFDGSMEEFRIWNVARSASDIASNMNASIANPKTTTGLIAYYQFNQGVSSGENGGANTLTDASASNRNGTLYNFALTSTSSNWVYSPSIWTGSNVWSNAANWSTGIVPASASDVVVSNGTLTVDQDATVTNFTVHAGAAVTLSASKTLTANGHLTIMSDATNGTGTFVDNGGTLSVSGSTKVEQNLTSGRNWYISSPVSDATCNVVLGTSGNSLWQYNEVNSDWVTDAVTTSTPFSVMRGFVTAVAADGPVTFTGGTLNTGNQSISVNRTENGKVKRGFNLLGNPYPSYVNWDMATKSNLLPSMWYRTKSPLNAYVFDSYNGETHVGTNLNGVGVTTNIPPMQAFWVKVVPGQTSGSLSFTNAMRTHKAVSDGYLLRSQTTDSQQVLKLDVSNGLNRDQAIVVFNANASNAYDNYDTPKMSNENVSIPEIYTMAGTEVLVINGLNNMAENKELPLGFSTGEPNHFTIQASDVRNFEAGTTILLKDKLLGVTKDLTDGESYSFTSDAIKTLDRFSLVFQSSTTDIGDNDSEVQAIHVFVAESNSITIRLSGFGDEKGTVSIYNTLGKTLLTVPTTGTETSIQSGLPAGIYLVKVLVDGKQKTQKVVLY
jgi:hypothetical protein